MDMKGITWVGNIYEKFEAMCLEVEEIVYQDTVKYVENQVQTVGSTVKKFYADVMQDLLPPSSVDPNKGEVADLPVDLYDVGIYIKPKFSMKEKSGTLVVCEPLAADCEVPSNKDPESQHTLTGPFHVDNLFPLSQADCIGGSSRKYGGTLTEKPNIVVEGTLKRKTLPSTASSGGTTLDKDLSRVSSVSKLSNENPRVSLDQISRAMVSESVEVIEHESNGNIKSEIENASRLYDSLTIVPSHDMDNLAESGRNGDSSMRDSPVAGLSADSNDDCTTNEATLPEECYSNSDEWSSTFVDKEDFILNSGRLDECSMVFNDAIAFTDHEKNNLQQIAKPKLHETCILVDSDEFHFVHKNEVKKRSYKKKLQHIFSSNKTSMRKQEYEQLALSQADYMKSLCSSVGTKGTVKLSQLESLESEWELL